MDDFEYSVQISDQDWDSFFLECEECNLLPPVLAGMEDSGMSDMDEIASYRALKNTEGRVPGPEILTTSPDHGESQVDLYLSRYGMSSPVHVLSGSEDDLHMESVNMFFERLKSVAASDDPLTQKRSSKVKCQKTCHLEKSVQIKDAKKSTVLVETKPNQGMQRWQDEPTGNELGDIKHVSAYCDTESAVRKKDRSLVTMKVQMKCDDPCKEKHKSSIGRPLCGSLFSRKELTSPYQEKEASSQLVLISDSDPKEQLVNQGPTSSITPRRRRKKKKRTMLESVEPDHGYNFQFQAKPNESDDDMFVQIKATDRDICPSRDCNSGTVSSLVPILASPSNIDSILDSLPAQPQLLLGNVMEPIMAWPVSESQSTETAVQNNSSPDVQRQNEVTGKLASAGQHATTVNRISTENSETVKKSSPLVLQSDDSRSAPTNGDNLGSHLDLLQASEALPGSITPCNKVQEEHCVKKSGSTENPHRVMNKDCTSSILNHTYNSQVNNTAVAPIVLLPTDLGISLHAYNSPQGQNHFEEALTMHDAQCEKSGAVFQRKTFPVPVDLDWVTVPDIKEKTAKSEMYINAEETQDIAPSAHINGQDILTEASLSGAFDSTSLAQSDPVNVGKSQGSLQNVQTSVSDVQLQTIQSLSPSAGTIKSIHSTEVNTDVSEQDVSNKPVTGRNHLDSQKEIQTQDVFPSLGLTNIPDVTENKEGKVVKEDLPSPAFEDKNESFSLKEPKEYQPLIQITDEKSQLGEDANLFNITTTSDEVNYEVHQVPPHCLSTGPDFVSDLVPCLESHIPESVERTENRDTLIQDAGQYSEHGEDIKTSDISSDCELLPSVVSQAMTPPLPNSVDETKIPETGKGKFTLHSQREDWTEETPSFLRSNNIADLPGIDKDNLSLTVEDTNKTFQLRKCKPLVQIIGLEGQLGEDSKSEDIFLTTGEEDQVPQQNPSKSEFLQSPVIQGLASSPLVSMDGEKYISSNNIPSVDEEKGGLPSHCSSTDHELSSRETTEGTTSPTLESTDRAESIETADSVGLAAKPVYAISSFWDEMEKLTINDILRLRLVSQAQHPPGVLQPEDGGIADISDAADSGYFTPLGDSKPDRSSGDMSFISDFDEELAQLQAQEATKSDEGSPESLKSRDDLWESDPDPSGASIATEDVLVPSSETAIPPTFCRDNAQQCFKRMCKNNSVQNLQALESQPFRKILRNASVLSLHSVHSTHSIRSEVVDDYVDPFDRVEASSPVCLSEDEDETESPAITFSEIIQYLFGGDEPERCTSAVDNVSASYVDGTTASVPETYDHFFSDFDTGSLFFPLVEDTTSSKEEHVPIYSCSRSANRNVQFPELYDYFFPDDSPASSEEDEEHERTATQVIAQHDRIPAKTHNAVAASGTFHEDEEPAPETNYGWNFLRNNPLSFRKTRQTGSITPPEKSNSWALTPVQNNNSRSFQKGIQPITAMGPDEMPFPDPLIFNLENSIWNQLANQPNVAKEMQAVVADPRVDAPLMPLKQADMCMVCIAFASWVLKSVNPQGADMWKAALLANISALSAIRYLRRHKRDEAAKKTPLRQIESA